MQVVNSDGVTIVVPDVFIACDKACETGVPVRELLVSEVGVEFVGLISISTVSPTTNWK